MESLLFEKLPHLRVIICRQCRYGVRPAEVERHLKRQHQFCHTDAVELARAIQQSPDLEQDSEAIPVPQVLDTPLPILPCHRTGLLCQQDPNRCQYLVSNMDTMRKHWRQDHQWSQQPRAGRVSMAQQAEGQAELKQSYIRVVWQQIFPSRWGSHYIYIRFPDGVPEPPPRITQTQQAVDAMYMSWQEQQERQQRERVVQAGQINDANPWLRLTRWAEYLQGVDPGDLIRISTTGHVDEGSPAGEIISIERAVQVLQATMAQLVRKSQQTVQHCGHAIRIEAVRTETSQTPYRPLMAYMNPDQIQKHIQPWQQVLGFIARTQTDWPWKAQKPEYGMTARQRRYWQRLWGLAQQAADERASPDPMAVDPEAEAASRWEMTAIETACLEFCIELLNQRYRTQEYESPLVCAMAVLGRSEKGWRDADSYPPILSRVIKTTRFLLVQKALWMDPDAPGIIALWQSHTMAPGLLATAEEDLYDIDEGFAEARQPTIPSSPPSSVHSGDGIPIARVPRPGRKPFQDCVEWMVRRFMVRGTHGPMQTLLDWRTYGLKIHYNTTAPGHVTWIGQERLLYQQVQFTMGEFRGFMHGLVGATRTLLGELLQEADLGLGLPAIPWDRLFDDPAEQTPGWSFLRDRRTPWPVDGARWMVDRLRGESGVQRQVMTRGVFQPRKIRQYLQQVARFLEKLAVAVHLTGGAPARAPELLSAQHVNTETNQQRNIYIEDGMVVLVTAYHKGFYASNDIKVIHRYLPREVGALVVYYLWLVRPFVQQLAWQLARAVDGLTVVNQPPAGPAGHGFTAVKHPPADMADPRPDDPGLGFTPVARRGLGFETITSPYIWGYDVGSGREWSSERLREVLKRETRTGLGTAMTVAHYRDIAIGISRRFLRPSSAFPNNIQQEQAAEQELAASGEDPDDWVGTIADEQAGHSAHVAGMVYGRESNEFAGSTMLRRLKFRASSTDWHQFLGFPAGGHPVLGKRANPWEEQAEAHQVERRRQLQATHMEPALQRMTGRGEMRLRGVQQPAIQAIQDGASPVVAVMPTGGGKSMLFMLPAWVAPGGCTIVVVPLISLRADLMQRCQQLGIPCVSWESRRPPDEAAIVLVTPESSEDPDFHTFLNRQRWMRRLDRIVVDECHIILNQQKDFRPAMARLGQLVSARTQMVFLTATLPPRMEEIFFQRIRHPASVVSMHRARTSRGNVAYRVWQPVLPPGTPREPHQWLVTPGVVQYIQGRIQQARGGRVVVYGQTKSQVQAISRELGCEAYHSQVVDRAGVMQRFQDGLHRVIAATSALGMGIDIPDIRCVIHAGRPRTLLEYGQESGRAGRDGQASEAVIIHPDGWETPDPWIHGVAAADFQLVQAYMGGGCRRYILDQYLDGTVDGYTRERCQDQADDELACDGCDPDWEAQEEPIRVASHPPRPGPGSGSRVSHIRPGPELGIPSFRQGTGSGFGGSRRGGPELGLPIDTVHQRPHPNDAGFGFMPHYATSSSEAGGLPDRPRAMSIDSQESIQSQVPRARVRDASPRYRAPMQQYEQAAVQQQAQTIQAGIDEEFMEQEAQRWLDQCYICTVQGRDRDHGLEQCRHAESRAAQEWLGQVQGRVDYIRFQCCYQCGMPQAICPGWQRGEVCTWRGALLPMIAGMLHGPYHGVVGPAWEQWLQRQQLEARVIFPGKIFQQEVVAGPVNAQDDRSVAAFFGQGTVDGQGVQVQAVFCWLRRACQDIEGGLG